MKRWLVILTVLFSVSAQANEYTHNKAAEEMIGLIRSHYLKIYERADLDDSDRKLAVRGFAEKFAGLDTRTYNAVVLELAWTFETQQDAMLPIAYLFSEVSALAPQSARLDERENKIVDVLDFAITLWLSLATVRGLHTTLEVARSTTHAARWKTALLQGTEKFWRSLALSPRTLNQREKWVIFGITSAETLYVACDLFLKTRRLDPLDYLQKSSKRILAVVQNDLNRSQKQWSGFLSLHPIEKAEESSKIDAFSRELKQSQEEALTWMFKLDFLSRITPLFEIFAFRHELLVLQDQLKLHLRLLREAGSHIDLLKIQAPNHTPVYGP